MKRPPTVCQWGFASEVNNEGNESRVFLCEFVDRSCWAANEDDPGITRIKHKQNAKLKLYWLRDKLVGGVVISANNASNRCFDGDPRNILQS